MSGETLRERAVHEAALAVRALTIPTNAASIIHASVDAVLAMVAEALDERCECIPGEPGECGPCTFRAYLAGESRG